MDLLISIGTLTAYIYSTVVLFFPDAIPGEEKFVYFEVSAVIIAFVLLGKYIEEAIKKKRSAAVRKLLDLKPAMAMSSISVIANSSLLRRYQITSGEENLHLPSNVK